MRRCPHCGSSLNMVSLLGPRAAQISMHKITGMLDESCALGCWQILCCAHPVASRAAKLASSCTHHDVIPNSILPRKCCGEDCASNLLGNELQCWEQAGMCRWQRWGLTWRRDRGCWASVLSACGGHLRAASWTTRTRMALTARPAWVGPPSMPIVAFCSLLGGLPKLGGSPALHQCACHRGRACGKLQAVKDHDVQNQEGMTCHARASRQAPCFLGVPSRQGPHPFLEGTSDEEGCPQLISTRLQQTCLCCCGAQCLSSVRMTARC